MTDSVFCMAVDCLGLKKTMAFLVPGGPQEQHERA